MIEPLARGVDPVQLAFQSLVSMGTRTQRTESPLAVALDRLGVDLARGEPLTTAEARQFVGLIGATLEVFETAVPAEQQVQATGATPETAAPGPQPAQGTGALLETAQVAMRDLQRALSDVLTDHRQLTTGLAPILRQLLVATLVETQAPESPSPVPARLFPLGEQVPAPSGANGASIGHATIPTLARLVSSLVESITRLQAVLPLDALPIAEGLAAPEQAGAPASAQQASAATFPPTVSRLLPTLVEALTDLGSILPLHVEHPSTAAPAPASQPLQNLARAVSAAVVVLHELLPATAAAGETEQSPVLRDVPRGPSSTQSVPASAARLSSAVAQVIRLVHQLLVPQPPVTAGGPVARPAAEVPRSLAPSRTEAPAAPGASRAEAAAPPAGRVAEASLPARSDAQASLAPARSPGDAPVAAGPRPAPVPPLVVAATLAEIPALLAASLAEVVASLPPAVLAVAAADDSAPLVTATLLAELEAATTSNPALAGLNVPVNPFATVDAYRWGLLVGLNYRPALGRPAQARLGVSRPRCESCSRLLVQTRSGALVCPTC